MKTSAIAALLLCLLLPAAHAQKAPSRIISLAPSITESLYQLGLEDKVIGITTYCPRGTVKKDIVGTLWEPDIEKIVSLAPDLVIASKEGNCKAVIYKIRDLGIPVYIINEDRSFDSLCDNYQLLGNAVGRGEKAKEIIAQAKHGVDAVRKQLSRNTPVRVFWEVGAHPLFTISRNSFLNDFNTYVCSSNIFGDITARYPKISREEVIRRNPDAIIIVAMGDVTKSEQDYWRKFPAVNAVRTGKIYVIESQEIFTPTPLTFLKGVERIAALLHTEQ